MRRSARSSLLGTTVAALVGTAATARADAISGFLEWNYSHLGTRSESPTGTAENSSDYFLQRYNLNLEARPFPLLRVTGGGTVEKSLASAGEGDGETRATVLTVQPYVDLVLSGLLYSAGAGYGRRQQTEESDGTRSTLVNEDYHALLGWRPAGLPTADLLVTRTNTFDADRALQDTTSDRVTLGLRYAPLRDLDLRYQGALAESRDHLSGRDLSESTQSGRASYATSFLQGRWHLSTAYNVTRQDVRTSQAADGTVDVQVFPLWGLSGTSDLPAEGELSQNGALVDGNLAVSAGVSLGVPPVGTAPAPVALGLDFFNDAEVSVVLAWVDRELPREVASAFAWDVYTSADGVRWTLWAERVPGEFGPFQNRFEIAFAPVTARFVKVVTSPLTAAQAAQAPGFRDPGRLSVTEVQAFSRQTGGSGSAETVRTSQIYNLDLQARLWDPAALAYSFAFFYARTDPLATTRYTLANGLSASRRLGERFTVSGRVAREDADDDANGHRVAYLYTASARAVPLPTLSHNLTYSGRVETGERDSTSSQSVYLNNTAELYPGVHVNAAGGVSLAHAGGEETRALNLVFGTSLVPLPTASVTANYTLSRTEQSGGDGPDGSSLTRRADLALSWRPFPTLYLVASISALEQPAQERDVTRNYGLNWSPLLDGDLQFSFSYGESARNLQGEKSRSLSPTLAWRVAPGAVLDLAYVLTSSDGEESRTDSQTVSGNFRWSF